MKKFIYTFSIVFLSLSGIAQNLSLDWAVRMGSTSFDRTYTLKLDASANVHVVGGFYNTVDFDPGPGVANLTAISSDAFVQKLDASGNFIWVKSIQGTGSSTGHSLSLDASGNIYSTGTFTGASDFNPGPSTFNLNSNNSSTDIYIQKLDPSGNFVWANKKGAGFADFSFSIVNDALGNVYATGSFQGTVNFGVNLTSQGANDIYIQKMSNLTGNNIWAKGIGGVGSELGLSVSIDGSGNIYTAGYFNNTVDFDPGAGITNLTSNGSNDIFIQKMDPSGNFLWANGIGGTGYDNPSAITFDASNNVYITGTFSNTVDFDPGVGTTNLTSAGGGDIFILKLDASGNFIWVRGIGGTDSGNDFGRDIHVDASGNIYVIGYFYGTVDFDPGSGVKNLTSAGGADIYFLKLDANGNYIWAEKIGGTGNDYVESFDFDASDKMYVTGRFENTVDFDPGVGVTNLTSAGSLDIFVLKFGEINLPIELLSFDAQWSNENFTSVDLEWVTESETNNDYFEVERSIDGINFTSILQKEGAGNSTHTINYTDIDPSPYLKGTSFYRLKQTDFDGSFSYSDIVVLNPDKNLDIITLYPNPNNGIFKYMVYSSTVIEVEITITNVLGQLVYFEELELNEGITERKMSVSKLSEGDYIIHIKTNTGIDQVSKKFVVND